MKMEHTECSETSAYNIETLGNYPEESIQNFYFLYDFLPYSVTVSPKLHP